MLELIEYFKNNNIMTIRYSRRLQRNLVFRIKIYVDFLLFQSYLEKWNTVNGRFIKINEFINYA